MKPVVYLDHAAATPMDPQVFQAMQPYFTELFYNPSALYWPAHEVAKQLQIARASVAGVLGARPSEIIFTAGGTEANNLAIQGVMRKFTGKKLVVSSVEHDSVLAPSAEFGGRQIPVLADGRVDTTALEALIDDETVLVSVQYANNEVGTIQPLREISQIIEKVLVARRATGNALPLYFHTDAAQAGNYLDLHVNRLGVDMLTLNGGKIYGPKQSGVLYVSAKVPLQPLIRGGGQERNLRSGTENVAACIGLAKALELVQAKRHEETKRLQELQQLAIKLIKEGLPDAVINGSPKHRLPNNLHITMPGQDNERLLVELDQRGILAAAGSACSASNDEPSHVQRAMGLSDADARSSLRLTMGQSTTEDSIRTAIDTLAELV